MEGMLVQTEGTDGNWSLGVNDFICSILTTIVTDIYQLVYLVLQDRPVLPNA